MTLDIDAALRRAGAALAAMALAAISGCAAPKPPPIDGIRPLKTIDLVVETTPAAFSPPKYRSGSQGNPTVPIAVPNVATGVAAGILMLISKQAEAKAYGDASKVIGPSVADIDIGKAFANELAATRRDQDSPAIASVSFDTDATQPEWDDNARPRRLNIANSSGADAVLFVEVWPTYLPKGVYSSPRVWTHAELVTRSGEVVMQMSVALKGPPAFNGSQAGEDRWWADRRYRTFLLHGIRAGALMVAHRLWVHPLNSDDVRVLAQLDLRSTGDVADVMRMRSDTCAVDSPSAPVVYRYDYGRLGVDAIVLCATNEKAAERLDPNPLVTRVTPVYPGAPLAPNSR